jgi:phosphatidylserine/phosphatidylglycerophosphate/cardiolipin synthase-like enzyme
MRFANGTAMNLVRLGLFLTACAISANGAEAGGSAATSLPPPDSIETNQRTFHPGRLFHPGSLAVLPEDGRDIYFEAFDAARREIRIEICVLEDPLVLQSLRQAIDRGVRVRVIVDHGKYEALPSEQVNLAAYLTGAGAQLHLSNPIFPRSFPKVILIDERYALIGSACLDTTTFVQYRDYAYVSDESRIIKDLSRLFENDWLHSAHPGQPSPTYNPTPVITQPNLIVSPVNSAFRLVSFIQKAQRTLDVTSELLGDPTLESELAAAAAKGVRVRLIAPETVNGATREVQQLQLSSLNALKAAGIHIHVTRPPESQESPYMHARTAVADGRLAYLGSISLSPDSSTYNREVGLILDDTRVVRTLQNQFEIDFNSKSHAY